MSVTPDMGQPRRGVAPFFLPCYNSGMTDKPIDILDETEALYRMQKQRVAMDAQWEEKLQKTFPSLNQDVRLLKELLTDLESRREHRGKVKGVIPKAI